MTFLVSAALGLDPGLTEASKIFDGALNPEPLEWAGDVGGTLEASWECIQDGGVGFYWDFSFRGLGPGFLLADTALMLI